MRSDLLHWKRQARPYHPVLAKPAFQEKISTTRLCCRIREICTTITALSDLARRCPCFLSRQFQVPQPASLHLTAYTERAIPERCSLQKAVTAWRIVYRTYLSEATSMRDIWFKVNLYSETQTRLELDIGNNLAVSSSNYPYKTRFISGSWYLYWITSVELLQYNRFWRPEVLKT